MTTVTKSPTSATPSNAGTSAAGDPTADFWAHDPAVVEAALRAEDASTEPAHRRRSHSGSKTGRRLRILGRQMLSPITLILIVAALIAAVTGDFVDGSIIIAIVAASAVLGAWQESRAADEVQALLEQVTVTIHVTRDGHDLEVAVTDVRPLDILPLRAGGIVPADCLLTVSDDLTVDESALTGESFPADKSAALPVAPGTALAGRTNSVFAGTHVVSGTGTALVVHIGPDTIFGSLSASLRSKSPSTSFETGIRRFGLMLLRVMLVLVAVTMIINLLLERPLVDSLLFALALAVGITPQMLPVVVSVSLAAGARRLAKAKVIVKRLDVIEDLGAMSVLCTDKTGTLTVGSVQMNRSLDVHGTSSPDVLLLATLNAGLQEGYPNPLDQAILAKNPLPDGSTRLDEVPYDFQRKRLSVVTDIDGVRTLITKGALDSVLAVSTFARDTASTADAPLASVLGTITKQAQDLGGQGYRVLGVATKTLDDDHPVDDDSEQGLTFRGTLVFDDPVKPSATASVADLGTLGVTVKVITGDNRYVTGAVALRLGVKSRVVLGAEIQAAHPADLKDLVTANSLFAEVEPAHKVAIVAALRKSGETVGFMGDGVNDAGALHAADVGLSVDTAVDVAKEAAAIVLLAQDLAVVATGVRLGRRTFANTLKYVRVAASANFGNILSMVIAAALLPFLPMLPAQILLLNFLADVPNTLVSRDRVDPERLRAAGVWNMHAVTRFMVLFGALSTLFDLTTFGVLEWGFHADATVFHTGWFVLSAITQFVAMMTLRTSRVIWTSRPDKVFFGVSAAIAIVTVALPYTPLAGVLGFQALPLQLVAVLFLIALGYGALNELVKRRFTF
jgi:Mg2+-importing ATPase